MLNEAETRAEYIDPMLRDAGWGVAPESRVRREYIIAPGRIEPFGGRLTALKADYVLEYRNTKLAAVEAKAYDEPLTLGCPAGEELRGEDVTAVHVLDERAGRVRHRHGDGEGRRAFAVPVA
jgi:type I restriction enzyme R subunit